jgi:UDP-N-acetylmuramate dehydrogenase
MPDDYRSRLLEFARRDVGPCYPDEPLARHASWRIGGPADLFVEPQTIVQVQNARRALKELSLPFLVVGDASNLLFDDQGIRGVALHIGKAVSGVSIDGLTVIAEAGISVPRFVRSLGKAGLSGLEHAVGIPGTLGGLIVMNGGSMRRCVGENIEHVWAVDRDGRLLDFEAADCGFSHRHSIFQDIEVTVVRARLRCRSGIWGDIRKELLATLRSRRLKFPLKQPNCGSVFVSDPTHFGSAGAPGKIIETCGLKGTRFGDAMVSPRHANFIVNLGHATCDDVLHLIHFVHDRVQKQLGIRLSAEVRYVSPQTRTVPADRARSTTTTLP